MLDDRTHTQLIATIFRDLSKAFLDIKQHLDAAILNPSTIFSKLQKPKKTNFASRNTDCPSQSYPIIQNYQSQEAESPKKEPKSLKMDKPIRTEKTPKSNECLNRKEQIRRMSLSDLKQANKMPKFPVSSFFHFYQEYKSVIGGDKHIQGPEIAKLLSEKWKKMSPAEKQPFIDKSEAQRVQYKAALEIYKEQHPEQYAEIRAKKRDVFMRKREAELFRKPKKE